MNARVASRFGVAALAAAMAWVALWSWGGLVEQPGRFLSPALLGALLVVVVGATGRSLRWPWYAVLPAQLVVVLAWLDHRYASAEAWGGWIPTVASVRALADRIQDGAVAINTFASPVSAEHPETYAYLLATSMLVLVSTDLLACGLRRVPWAGLPVIVTLTVPISVLDSGLSWVVFFGTAMLFMMLLATEETQPSRAGVSASTPSTRWSTARPCAAPHCGSARSPPRVRWSCRCSSRSAPACSRAATVRGTAAATAPA